MPQLFPLPDSSGLKPLTLPESIASNLNSGDGGHLPQKAPSPDAVDRFQKAMSTPIQPISRLAAAIAAAPAREQPPVTHAAPQTDPSPSANQPSNVGFQPPAAAKSENTELPDVVQVATSDHPVESRSFEVFSGNSHTVPTAENRVASTTESRVAPTTENRVAPTTENRVASTTENRVASTTESRVAPTTESRVAPTTENRVAPTTENRVAPTTENRVAPTTESHATPTTGTVEHVAEDISLQSAAKVPAKGYNDHEKPIADIGSSPAPAATTSLQPPASPREAMPREAVPQTAMPHELPKGESITSEGGLPTSDFGLRKTPELQVKTPEIQASGSNAPEVKAKTPEIQSQGPTVPEVQTPGPKTPEVQAQKPNAPDVQVKTPEIQVQEPMAPEVQAQEPKTTEIKIVTVSNAERPDLSAVKVQNQAIETVESKHQAAKSAPLQVDTPVPAVDSPLPVADKLAPIQTDTPTPVADKQVSTVDRPLPIADKQAPVEVQDLKHDAQGPKVETAEGKHQAAKSAPLPVDTPAPSVDKPAPVADKQTPVADKSTPIADKPTPTVDKPLPIVDKQVPVEVQDLRHDAQGPKIEVAEIRHQVEKPATLQAEKPAPSAEKPVSMVDKPLPPDDRRQAAKVEDVVIPIVVPLAQDSAPIAAASAAIEIDPSAAAARTSELTEAAAAVAETIKVTPSLVRGDGEVVIRLKPSVLDGSEIRLEARGSEVTIDIRPANADVAQAVERSQAQFAQQLAERLPSFQFTVAVATAKPVTARKSTSNETT